MAIDPLLELDPFAVALAKKQERETVRLVDQSPSQPDDQETARPVERETIQPKQVEWSPALDDQTTGRPIDQETIQLVESDYPSRRNKVKIGVRLPSQKVEKYKLWCLLNKVDLQDAVERGLDWVTGGMVDQSTGKQGGRETAYQYDDLDNALNDDIINFYEKLTKNKWKEADTESLREVEHYAPHILKAGVVLSLHRVKTRINSFRYCVNAIHESAEAKPGPDYLQYLLSRLKS